MAIFIQLYQNERNGTTKGKWYGRTKIVGTKTLKDIAERIQRNASMTVRTALVHASWLASWISKTWRQ